MDLSRSFRSSGRNTPQENSTRTSSLTYDHGIYRIAQSCMASWVCPQLHTCTHHTTDAEANGSAPLLSAVSLDSTCNAHLGDPKNALSVAPRGRPGPDCFEFVLSFSSGDRWAKAVSPWRLDPAHARTHVRKKIGSKCSDELIDKYRTSSGYIHAMRSADYQTKHHFCCDSLRF